jgi:Zn-dependent peptidase ImmA (M78 family)
VGGLRRRQTPWPKELRVSEAFFFRPAIEAPTPLSATFRSLKAMTAGRRDAALAAGAFAFEIAGWLDARFHVPPPDVPDLRDYEPDAAAMALRRSWGVGERPIGNMVHLLEAHGVRVFSLDEHRSVDAFSLWHRDVPFVFLNTVKTAEHARLDAAHELGHLVLHRAGSAWGGDVEKEAQAFGAAFLMPRASVLATVPRLVAATLDHLVQLKSRWGVSAAALAHRLHRLEVITAWNYHRLCVALAKYGRTREPEPQLPRETSQVFSKVFLSTPALASKSAVAADLGLHVRDVEALTFGTRSQPNLTTPPRTAARVGRPSLRLVAGDRPQE